MESGEWRVQSGEWREESAVRAGEEAPGGEAPPIGDHTADFIWFFIFADCLVSRSFVCLFFTVLLQQTLTKLVFRFMVS